MGQTSSGKGRGKGWGRGWQGNGKGNGKGWGRGWGKGKGWARQGWGKGSGELRCYGAVKEYCSWMGSWAPLPMEMLPLMGVPLAGMGPN